VADVLQTSAWDLIPVISELRGIIRGGQTASWASRQTGFGDEQLALQAWYNCSYGYCHYPSVAVSGPQAAVVGGPMPTTPLVDVYSTGMGELAGNVTQLVTEAVTGRVIRTFREPEVNVSVPIGSRTLRISRIAPLGNEVPLDLTEFRSISANLPHFHAQVLDEAGGVLDFQGLQWHRPLDDVFYLLTGRRP